MSPKSQYGTQEVNMTSNGCYELHEANKSTFQAPLFARGEKVREQKNKGGRAPLPVMVGCRRGRFALENGRVRGIRPWECMAGGEHLQPNKRILGTRTVQTQSNKCP